MTRRETPGMIGRAALLWRTGRHLRPVQVYNRVARRFVRGLASDVRDVEWLLPSGPWMAPIAPPPVLIGPSRARIHECEHDVATGSDWNSSDVSALWRYHLHYFDELGSPADARRAAWHLPFIERWLRDNPIGRSPAWDPYPTSLRIVNWLKWGLAGNPIGPAMASSLREQVGWLERRLEYHLLGNHLFENAKAMWFAGACSRGVAARRWLSRGRALQLRELGEQVLEDGGHFERSPMYHARILENVLDLVNLERASGRPDSEEFSDAAARMLRWLSVMTHPDGTYALFNDAAVGQAPGFGELRRYAASLGIDGADANGSAALPVSGYYRLQSDKWTVLCDLAPIGPDYLPAHAHADTLTFEASLGGERVVVDTGTSTYEIGPRREHERSTAAHNVVCVDGRDSSEVWGGFRVGRRARIHEVRFESTSRGGLVGGAHDGYRHYGFAALQHRDFQLDGSDLRIIDRIDGRGDVSLEWRMHLHPGVSARPYGSFMLVLEKQGRPIARVLGDERLSWSVQPTTHHPRFGVIECCSVVVGSARVCLPTVLRTKIVALQP